MNILLWIVLIIVAAFVFVVLSSVISKTPDDTSLKRTTDELKEQNTRAIKQSQDTEDFLKKTHSLS